MERWRTLSKQEAEFERFLLGEVDQGVVAIPRKSFHIGTQQEEITFELIPESEIEKPHWLAIGVHSLRPESLLISLAPMLSLLAWLSLHSILWNAVYAVFCISGVLLFHAGVNLLNDFSDHISGLDRRSPFGGSRAIQRGWSKAVRFRNWGIVLLTLAVLDAFFMAWNKPFQIGMVGAISLLCAWGLTTPVAKKALSGLREIAAFGLGGPLLFYGVLSSILDTQIIKMANAALIFLCLSFACNSLLYVLLSHWASLMEDSKRGLQNMSVRWGFDLGKRWIAGAALASWICMTIFVAEEHFPYALIFALLLYSWFCFQTYFSLKTAVSPLSSGVANIRNQALWMNASLSGGILLWYLVRL